MTSSADEQTERKVAQDPIASFFHVHLVSDSTGDTLNKLLHATASQFSAAKPIEHIHTLVRSKRTMESTIAKIDQSPGLVLYTVHDPQLRRMLEIRCSELQIPLVPVLDPLMDALTDYLGIQRTIKPGAQHKLDDEYFKRISAIDYTINHDDGQMTWDLEPADVVLIGVSRTSKTPTCMYLANRGIRAANIPLVPHKDLPENVLSLQNPLVVGLVASPERLSQLRKSRITGMDPEMLNEYIGLDFVRAEVVRARRLFAKQRWSVIDVTRKSVEETAAAILSKLSVRRNG